MKKRLNQAAVSVLTLGRSALLGLIRLLTQYGDDLLIVAGLACIVAATFSFGTTAGLYALGVVLVGLGIVLARQPPRGR